MLTLCDYLMPPNYRIHVYGRNLNLKKNDRTTRKIVDGVNRRHNFVFEIQEEQVPRKTYRLSKRICCSVSRGRSAYRWKIEERRSACSKIKPTFADAMVADFTYGTPYLILPVKFNMKSQRTEK